MSEKYLSSKLEKATNDLFYEIWMMKKIADIVESGTGAVETFFPVTHTHSSTTTVIVRSTDVVKTSDDKPDREDVRVINNALIESFGIHVRSLLDFFYAKKKHKNDVLAEHFYSTPNEWIKLRPEKSDKELKKIKDRVNKEIAHLTYDRQKVKEKSWPFSQILKDLNKVIDIFIESVPRNLLSDQWI